MANVSDWPFNPNFPRAFSFPAFGTVEWLALAWWRDCKGSATQIRDADNIRTGAKLKWQTIWFGIYQLNHAAAYCRFLNRIHFANADAASKFGCWRLALITGQSLCDFISRHGAFQPDEAG